MALRAATGTENYPPKWAVFDRYVSHVGARSFNFATDGGEINRFAARYRAAKSFQFVEFNFLTRGTKDGYSVLVKLLLTYSAFEHLLRCIGMELRNTHTLLSDEERSHYLDRLRALNGNFEFFGAVRSFLDQRHYLRQYDAFLSHDICNLFYIAGGVRHAFAHGQLAANPSTCPPDSVATCGRFLVNLLGKVMDREFKRRMDEFEAEMWPVST